MSEDELRLRIDHVNLSVEDIDRARHFYAQLLAPLGMELVAEHPAGVDTAAVAGFGVGRKGAFWLFENGKQTPQFHGCFRAESRAQVRAFHKAGVGAGGQDNGPPGVREVYHPSYYAAFVLDPEGHNIEAVTFEPEPM